MDDKIRNHGLRQLLLAAAMLVLSLVAGVAWVGHQSGLLFEENAGNWRTFRAETERKIVLIAEMRSALGYGGMIHDFKNLVLRRELRYAEWVERDFQALFDVFDRYDAMPMTPRERRALTALRATADEYRTNFLVARERVVLGASSAEIDRLVKVDDGAALRALAVLDEVWIENARGTTARIAATADRGIAMARSLLLVVPMLAALAGFLLWLALRFRGESAGTRGRAKTRSVVERLVSGSKP